MPEGYELEDGGVYQLAGNGGHVVADPEVFALGDLAPEGEHEHIKLLGYNKADQ